MGGTFKSFVCVGCSGLLHPNRIWIKATFRESDKKPPRNAQFEEFDVYDILILVGFDNLRNSM